MARNLLESYMTIIDDPVGTENRMEYGKLLEKSRACAIKYCKGMIVEREVIYVSIGVEPGTFWQDTIKELEEL